jgi:hypothetical protein
VRVVSTREAFYLGDADGDAVGCEDREAEHGAADRGNPFHSAIMPEASSRAHVCPITNVPRGVRPFS